MAYIVQADLKGMLPDEFLDEAMDDTDDDGADSGVWDSVSAAVSSEIDGRLAASYAVPIAAPFPDILKAAAKVLSCYLLYKRRAVSEENNPWAKDAEYWKGKLDRIGTGEEALTYSATKATEPAVLISEPSKTYSASGSLMV